ncbi:MAG: metallophosphoesterase [Candidatus Nanohaloarchaea archaeon]|nr:metallophosphoesterase [Candidatus Nanohaloarchaea archaeon]
MQVAIVSDTHFGFQWGNEREDDPFRNATEAFERTVDADIVILPGDIFDKKVPKQEVLGKAVDCFNIYRSGDCTVEIAGDSDIEHDFDGTPVVAIHGTHERRSEGFTNPIELLDKMGYLLHLHNETVVFEKNGEQVAVHGMSGVPERYAPAVLDKFDPEPVPDAYNIFVFHQSVENLVYTSPDHDALTMEDLPDGFDLLVDGHIHWFQHLDGDRELVLPGSTVTTQMNRTEAEQPKGFVTVDTAADAVEFHELDAPRELYYEEIDVDGMSAEEVMDAVRERMTAVLDQEHERRPLVRLKLDGETSAAVKQSEIQDMYGDDAILSLSLSLGRGSSTVSSEVQDSASVAEIGMEVLTDNLDHDLPVEDLFDLLADEELDAALDRVEELDVTSDNGSEAAGDTARDDEAEGQRSAALTEFSQ